MAREKFIVFDGKEYLTALSKEMKAAVADLRFMMYQKAREYLSRIDWHDNEVALAEGPPTSDRKRAHAVMESLIQERITHIVGKTIRTTVSALKTNFKDSSVGLYYEYGTGQLTDPEATYESLGTPNALFRTPNTQSPIVTRSKNYDFGYGKGYYLDTGGNLRKTNAPFPGKRNAAFIAYIGEDIRAEHWFRDAFKDIEKVFMDKYKEALAFIHPAKYFRLSGGGDFRKRGKFVLG